MTKFIRCIEGHVYDADENNACPVCGAVPGIEGSGRSAVEIPEEDGKKDGAPKQSLLSKAKPLLSKAKAGAPKPRFLRGVPRLWLAAGAGLVLMVIAAVYAFGPRGNPDVIAQNDTPGTDAQQTEEASQEDAVSTDEATQEADDEEASTEGDEAATDNGAQSETNEQTDADAATDEAQDKSQEDKSADEPKEGELSDKPQKDEASDDAKVDQPDDAEPDKEDPFADLRDRAVKHFTNKDYDSAIADFTDIIRQGSATWEDYNMRGMSYHYKKDLDLALADYARAIAQPDHREFVHYNRALILRKNGDADGAVAELTAAIEKHNSEVPSHYLERADIRLEQAEYDTAIADYDKAIELLSRDESVPKADKAFAYYMRGVAKERKVGNDPEIAKDNKTCKDMSSDKAGDKENCRYETALLIPLLDFEAAAVIYPDYARAHVEIGWIAAEIGHFQKAVDSYTKAIKIEPTYSTAYANRCLAYSFMKQNELAMADCNDAIRHDSNNPRAWTYRGFLYATRRGRTNRNRAIADLRQALKVQPGYREALRILKQMGVKP